MSLGWYFVSEAPKSTLRGVSFEEFVDTPLT